MFNDSTRDKDDTTVGVGHSRRYCNTGYDQSQGRRPSTLKCIGPISKGDIEPQPSSQKLVRNRTASRSRSDGRSRRYVQYRADQSQTETIIAKLSLYLSFFLSLFKNCVNTRVVKCYFKKVYKTIVLRIRNIRT